MKMIPEGNRDIGLKKGKNSKIKHIVNQIGKINITGRQYTTTTFNTEGTPHHN